MIMRYFVLIAVATSLLSCGGRGKGEAKTETVVQVVALSDSLIVNRRADTVAFGSVRNGESVTRELTIKNVGEKALVITGVDLSCGCVQADYPRQPLLPDGEAVMSLTLETKDLMGRVFKTVGVRTSAVGKAYTLVITAEVAAE